jgi:hypothetical protein
MRGHSLALTALVTIVAAGTGFAQPAPATPPPAPPADAPKPEAPPADAPPPNASDAPPPDAQAPVKDPVVAKKWLDAAATLLKKGDLAAKQGKATDAKTSYDNAVVAYSKAIEASDDVSIHYSLALALEKSGDVAGAIKHLKTVTAAQGLTPDVIKKSQTKLDQLLAKVGVVTLVVTPEGSQISVDGAPAGEAPMADPIIMMPGSHTVTATAVGYQPKDLKVEIEAGSESERKLDLDPVPVVIKHVEPAEPEHVEPPPPKPGSVMLPLYIGGGATAGLLVITAVSGLVAVSLHGKYEDASNLADRAADASSGKHWALATDICLVGTIGAAAFTTYWYLQKVRPHQRAMAERTALGAKVNVVPWVQSDAGGMTAVGSF